MSGHESTADINSLQEALTQQQQKISALREMVRKSETSQGKKSSSSTTEKVKNITKKLTHLKAKARSAFYSGDSSLTSAELEPENEPESIPVVLQQQLSVPLATQNVISSSTGSEKVQLLRQQMEQNKLRLAQRASSKLHLEQLVSELKEKLDSTQQSLDDSTQLGKSMTDLSQNFQFTAPVISTTSVKRDQRHRSATDLTSQPAFNLEKERMKFLENRCRLLEKQLEKERQAIATKQNETENEEFKRRQELENRILELEQNLQEAQKHLIPVEEIKSKEFLEQRVQELQQKLEESIEEKESNEDHQRIKELEERLLALEKKIVEQTLKEKELSNENERLRNEIARKPNDDDQSDNESKHFELIDLRNENSRMSKRIAELIEINNVLEVTRCDLASTNNICNEKVEQLENEMEKMRVDLTEVQQLNESNEMHTNEFSEDTESQIKTEMAKQIQELQEFNQKLQNENDKLKETIAEHEKVEIDDVQITAKLNNLEATIESQREDLTQRQISMGNLEEELMEKTIELNVLNANFRVLEEKLQTLSKSKNKPLFSTTSRGHPDSGAESDADLKDEVHRLKQKLDESNKAMIKLKLKCKQSEKQIEKLKKSSNLNQELIELQKLNDELQQRVTELEDEKGQWQLMQLKEIPEKGDADNQNKIQIETIRLLEEQKYEQSKELEKFKIDLRTLQEKTKNESERVVIARVESELSEIHLEEQLEEIKKQNELLQQQLDEQNTTIVRLQQQNDELQLEKQNLDKKLELYLSENMELLDKVEKLSKSSSSAESIEIVDRLTHQERAEMDEFNKRMDRVQKQSAGIQERADSTPQHTTCVSELTQTEMGYELGDSLTKLREESSELMNKVAMFTSERREVLEKMESLTTENHELQQRIDELMHEKNDLEKKIIAADELKLKLETELQTVVKQKEILSTQVAETTAQKGQLSGELTSMQKSTEVIAALDNNDGCITLFDKCEKSLSKLDAELEAYRRANDKNSKFNASKKLAKEAKNAHTQLSELLQKVKESSSAVETVTVVETVVAVTAPNGKALAEYEQLTAQNRELKTTVEELRNKVEELEDSSLHETISELVEIKPNEIELSDNKRSEKEAQKMEVKLQQYEEECETLKSTVDELTEQLTAVNIANEVKDGEITRLNKQLEDLRKISDDFEKLLKDKETDYTKQAEQFTRLRKELEGKCEVYEGEMEILQTLVTEQKQQLIEAFKEHEHEINLKLLDLQQRDEEITKMRNKLNELCESSRTAGAEFSNNLEKECEKLRESLRINKTLNAEQINELANKQETIDTLKQEIDELNENIREWMEKFIEKDDEAADLRITIANNKQDYNSLQKDNDEQKRVVDKLLNELHSYKGSKEQIAQLELEAQKLKESKSELENSNRDLEKRCKEQLEKMKKYAVNLKKRAAQCQELESKIQALETKTGDSELQQELNANIVLMNERIIDYEYKMKSQEEHLIEIQAALQAKTIEMLESIENNEKLEHEIKSLKNELEQREQDIIQLKNALAADTTTQQQKPLTDDWDNSAFDEKNISDLNAELEVLKSELIVAREEIITKEQAIKEFQEEKQQFEENENTRKQNILQLEMELNQNKTKFNEKENELQKQLQKLSEELSAKSLKFEKSKAVIKDRNNQIQRLQAQLKELQEKLASQPEEEEQHIIVRKDIGTTLMAPTEMEPKVSKIDYDTLQDAFDSLNAKYTNEKNTFEQTIARLETLHDGIQAKLQEDMSYIESLEQENARIKEKICKLEECVGSFEERRSSMERRANLLDAQMQSRTDEHNKAEDELIYRLNMLSAHDEVIAQRLIDTQEEKDILQDRLDKLQREFTDLTAQSNKLEKEYKNFKEQNEAQLNVELQTLQKKLEKKEVELERVRATYDAKLAVKATEIDELENDLSDQLARINAEKRSILEDLEKSRDECTELKDELMRLNESFNAAEQSKQECERELNWLRMQNDNAEQDQYELQELRMQAIQDKTELDNLRQQIETLANNHQTETDALRMQIADLDNIRMQVSQNQTDDQVFIETENKRLSELLSEKEAIIAEYQRQNLQLQMAASSNTARNPQPPDLFASIGSENYDPQLSPINLNSNALLEQELAEKNALIARLQAELTNLSRERPLEGNISRESHATTSMPSFNSNDIIPAPPMFFAPSQAPPTPFDEIVQRRIEQPQLSVFPTAELEHQSTIEDLQRNVSDLEKYNQELEHKLAARNNQIEEFHQHMNEAHRRKLNAEQEIQRLEEQLKQTSEQLQQRTELQEQLELRIGEIEEQLKEKLNDAASNNIKSQQESEHAKEIEERLKICEKFLDEREKNIEQLKQQLDATLRLTTDLESHIITESENIAEDEQFKSNVAPSLDMFFGNTTAEVASTAFEDIIIPPQIPQVSNVPVIEDEIVPKKAYLCEPDAKEGNVSMDFNFDFGDDVWNATEDAHWGGSDSAAAAENVPTQSLLSHEQQLELDLQSSNERIKELENMLSESELQKRKFQEKLTKSLKVVSKYKTQNVELKRSSTGSTTQANFFDDLDATIQDELKQQISKLETELNEYQRQQKEAAIEKEKLLKRIDVLTAGNDRMTEMKERQDMDMDMYKMRIYDLQQKLNKLEDWDGGTVVETSSSSSLPAVEQINTIGNDNAIKIQEFESRLKTLQAEVEDLNGDKQELQALLDEERANQNIEGYQQRLAELNIKYSNVCEELETLKTKHDSLENNNRQLHNELDELKRSLVTARAEGSRCNDLKQMHLDLENKLQKEEAQHLQDTSKLQSECRELKEELEKLRTEYATTSGSSLLSSNTAAFDELTAKIQEKDVEIEHLKQHIEDLMREDQTEKLVLEILTKNQEIHMLKVKVKDLEDDKQELEHNLTLQISKEMQEQQLKIETNANDEALKRVHQLEMHVKELQEEKHQMEEELNVLNAHVLSSLEMEEKLKKAALDLDTKNIEIKELRQTLESLRSNAEKQSNSAAQQETDVTRWEAIVEQRCSEIAQMWRTHLEQRELEFKNIEESLKAQLETLQKAQQKAKHEETAQKTSDNPIQPPYNVSVDTSAASSTPASATSPSVSADSSSAEVSKDGTPLHIINEADADEIITKMQTALENQELEIVSLKEQLAIRSAEYAALAAQYDPFKLQTGSSFDSSRSMPQRNSDNADVVPKSELDLAMYMLHQRDMRIEEMTVELVALLEERDTLQLKLSNTIRQMEAIKSHTNYVEPSTTELAGTTAVGTTPTVTSSDSPLKSISSTGSSDKSANELNQKLSQLQTVNHSKDKLIQEEREHRLRQMDRMRQIDRIQQDVARIPPAAVSELIGADISQSNQSPSSALMNWLWGNKHSGSDNGGPTLN